MKHKALMLAVVTTVLWSGSYILNKLAFQEGIGPLTLSAMRYLLASLLLLCIVKGKTQKTGTHLSLGIILLLGILGYAVAQGLQYVGQSYLTPTQSSLFLSVGNTAMVMLVGRIWLRENQTRSDLVKLLVLLFGICVYYYPFGAGQLSMAGLFFMALSSAGYALHMTFNRRLLTTGRAGAGELTARPMLVGALILLAFALVIEGPPVLTGRLLLILAYLGGISGALGFYLWTRSQSALTAFESSGINNLMLIEIALMDFIFFRRTFTVVQAAAVLIVFCAVVSIQGRAKKGR